MTEIFSTTSQTQPGYFRIGFVILQIPPSDISTNKVVNDDQVSTLRTTTAMFVKTGQARWDVTVHWKAVRTYNSDGTPNTSQWEDLQNIVAIFRASPFVEVENAFLRQHFTSVQPAYAMQRMAFALKQLRVDTGSFVDTDVLDVTLTMSLFNYSPYSINFNYTGNSGNASDSPEFQDFISSWITQNITNHPLDRTSPPLMSWDEQDDGVITFNWRKYIMYPISTEQPSAQSNASAGYTPQVPPASTTTPSAQKSSLSDAIQSIVNSAASSNGVPTALATWLCIAESNGNPNAGRGRVGTGLGLFQLTASTARGLGVTDVWDPTQNANGGCKYLAQQYKIFGNWPQALAAYNVGAGAVKSYVTGKPLSTKRGVINPEGIISANGIPPDGTEGESPQTYVQKILSNAGMLNLLTSVPTKSTDGTAPKTPTSVVLPDSPPQALIDQTNKIISDGSLPPGIWRLDHWTEQGIFFYQEQSFTLATADLGGGDYNMFPNQISIVFVNNLPTIPLASMQYPTFQHVGPTDTLISINFDSIGDSDSDTIYEPEHEGIEAMVAMHNQLQEQFHQLRNTFRAVSSIHRMQAVTIQNQVLNLLGVQGVMVRGITTETVPETANHAQVNFLASQYENVFEDTSPYIMNGIPKAYSAPLKNILTSTQLNQLTPEEQKTLTLVTQFSNSWKQKDPVFLLSEMLKFSQEQVNFIGKMGTPSANLSAAQQATLLDSLNQGPEVTETNNFPQAAALAGQDSFQRDTYPGLFLRSNELQNTSSPMTFADYFVFSQLPQQANSQAVAAIRTSTEATFSSQEQSIYDQMYSSLFDLELLNNGAFAKQAITITNSPLFASQFSTTVTVDGPALQKDSKGNYINAKHVCYNDLGLTSMSQNPASYFVPDNASLNTTLAQEITNALGTSNQSANLVNATDAGTAPTGNGWPTTSKTAQGYSFTAPAQIPGQASALIRQLNAPAFSMASAYPTFKMLLLEEDNLGPFYAFDNFYSYASVMDIEIIKYRDKPDTAIVQITNLAHTLQHRLYDDTVAGKLEAEADKFSIDPTTGTIGGPGVAAGEQITGTNPTSGVIAGKSLSGAPYLSVPPRKNLVEGGGESWTRVPQKFFALQTGSKIQIRMGYSNNPDALFPVFTGQVTDIQGEDVLTLTCQSFMLELMKIPGSFSANTAGGSAGFNFSSRSFNYGAWSGDTRTMMQTLMNSPVARHFGHWQLQTQPNGLVKGFQWSAFIGQVLESTSNTTLEQIGGLLQTGYDRSGENIQINSVIDFDATKSSSTVIGSRVYDVEHPHPFLGSASYYVDKKSQLTLWEILRDISRRYPHYNLMVRDYGFPYGADASLVYCHPLGTYYSRPKLLGDAEVETPNDRTQAQLWSQWWPSIGLPGWNNNFATASKYISPSINISEDVQGIAVGPAINAINSAKSSLTPLAASGPEGFYSATRTIEQILTGTLPTNSTTFQNIVTSLQNALSRAGNLLGEGGLQNVAADFQQLYDSWIFFLQSSEPAANSSRIKPMRNYHLIDHNHIIHNGITINDDIYNAVRIKDETFPFNQNIPDQHARVLDVTAAINDPDENVLVGNKVLRNSYAQSFLREEVGKMYEGELIIRGEPKIQPFDVIILNDPSTGMVGPVEVDNVIHSFNQENGYITIIKPRLLIACNEAVTLGLVQTISSAWSQASINIQGLTNLFNPFSTQTTASARILECAEGLGIIAATIFTAAWCPPLAIVMAAFGLLAGAGILSYGYNRFNNKDNFFAMMPLTRFGRPWLGGLQGFAIGDFAYGVGKAFQWFDAEEIAPTIESWREFMHYRADYSVQY